MEKKFVEIGKITGARGIKGELKVVPWSDAPEDFAKYSRFFLEQGGKFQEFQNERARSHQNMVLLQLKEISSVEAAASLRGQILYVKASDMPRLPDGKYYFYELLGLPVVLPDGKVLGKVREIMQTGANDVYVVQNGEKEYLIPAVPGVVSNVDQDRGRIEITPLPGLLED